MQAEPKDEHRWLHKFIGEWTFTSRSDMGPDQPPSFGQGREVVRSLGGLWIIGEGVGEMPGGMLSQSIMTLGYDPKLGRFVGTFIASVMSHLWPYNGTLDADRRVLTLDSEGPDFTDSKMAKYRDSFEFLDDDHRVMTASYQDEAGAWHPFMTVDHIRQR